MSDVLTWEIRNPDGAAQGLEYARARMVRHENVLAHALPRVVDVEVRGEGGDVVARGVGLEGTASTPMARLGLRDGTVERTNVWPDDSDVGKPVILPGGEVGTLRCWWHAEDRSEWRWTVEFHNESLTGR